MTSDLNKYYSKKTDSIMYLMILLSEKMERNNTSLIDEFRNTYPKYMNMDEVDEVNWRQELDDMLTICEPPVDFDPNNYLDEWDRIGYPDNKTITDYQFNEKG